MAYKALSAIAVDVDILLSASLAPDEERGLSDMLEVGEQPERVGLGALRTRILGVGEEAKRLDEFRTRMAVLVGALRIPPTDSLLAVEAVRLLQRQIDMDLARRRARMPELGWVRVQGQGPAAPVARFVP